MLSNACRYVIKALVYLAMQEEGDFKPLQEISAEMEIPRHFLSKILRPLVERGWLESSRGPNGGLHLTRPPSEITVRAVIEEVDGKELFEECLLGLPGCGEADPCPLHETWRPVKNQLRGELRETTIADLARDVEGATIRLS